MAQLSPEGAFDTLKDRVAESIASHFPFEGSRRKLVLNKAWVEDRKDIDDLASQLDARLTGRSWDVPVRADVSLVDKETGKVLDRSKITVAKIPKITPRYSYIVNGKEQQIENQFRLKSGVYHREDEAGNLTTHWNIAKWDGSKQRGFQVQFDPKDRKFNLQVATTKDIGLYPVLRAMGVSDDEMKKQWGDEIFNASVKKYGNEKRQLSSLNKLLAKTTGKSAETLEEARVAAKSVMEKAELRADSTKITLGKPYDRVGSEVMLRSSRKLLSIARGEEKADDRESLMFKDLLSAEDLITDRLDRSSREIKRRLNQGVDSKDSVRQIVNPAVFGKPLNSFFETSLAHMPNQTNPLEFVTGHMKTTIMGPGGISQAHRVPEEATRVNASHLGFLDPVATPEGEKTGITLQLPLGVEKDGRTLYVRAFNRKTGKMDSLNPEDFDKATVAFSDQVRWVDGMPIPKGKEVAVAAPSGNSVERRPYGEVTHVLPSSKAAYGMATNLIPFLQNNQGNRAMTASRQQEQAMSLVEREAPYVQTATEADATFEEVLGSLNSHEAPVSGEVIRVTAGEIVVKDKDNKSHKVQIYDNFPLNQDAAFMESTPTVSKGDKVKKGQLLADTNFTDKGTLALGKNLRVGYVPFNGYNFEDGVVISEGAATKLTSAHMHRPDTRLDSNSVLNKKRFLAYLPPGTLTNEQMEKLDDDGIIKPGARVEEGDILIGKLQKEELSSEQKMLQRLRKSAVKPYRDRKVTWDKGYSGTVTRVVKGRRGIEVHVKTEERAQIGDKIVGRHGNKGIISKIIPDHEMPHTADGRPIDIALNPAGVPGRINLGQVLETAAGKIAEKTGKPYVVENFPKDEVNYLKQIKKDLKAHGLTDTEMLTDPLTGKEMGKVMIGNQYMFKLRHKVDKKMSVRAGGVGNPYTANRVPRGGADRGGQSMGALGLYSLLSHGARHNVREMQTMKSDRNDDLWIALQAGESLPPPKPTFSYEKFKGYLSTMGINVEKNGNSLNLRPLTDKAVLDMSHGELKDAGKMFRGKDMRPEAGGLFDEKITGGPDGTKWSHIALSEAIPNPIFEKAISGLLGIRQQDIPEIVAGKQELQGRTGPSAIVKALKKVDVATELKKAKSDLKTARKGSLNAANRKVRYLQALKEAKLTPAEAYTSKHLPVLPPTMRPVSVLDNGSLNMEEINGLYKSVALTNQKLKDFDKGLPPELKEPLRAELYDEVKALRMTGQNIQGRHYRGVLKTIAGDQPKRGYFQDKIISRKQDLSMRSTIIPEGAMGLDEVGLPRKAAIELYKPLLVRELVQGFGYTPLQAQKAIKENKPIVEKALEQVASSRPVLMKRDPSLHKHSVMAFKPKIVGGKAIQIHPLVTGGYGADFDGDTMAVFVPLTREASMEAHELLPSKNLFNASTGKIVHKPGHEAQLGMFQLSRWGKKKGKKFSSGEEALAAMERGEIEASDVVDIVGELDSEKKLFKLAAPVKTTAGRLLLARTLPDGSEFEQQVLHDPSFRLGKGGTAAFLTGMAKSDGKEFADSVNKLNQLGNKHTFKTGFSFSLDDFESHPELRDPILRAAEREAVAMMQKGKPRNDAIVEAYSRAIPKLDAAGKKKMTDSGNRVFEMVQSGARGTWDQFKQITIAPVLVADTDGSPVPIPIKRSYSEGLSAPEYWASMSGARMGTLAKVSGTSRPGALTKDVVNVSMDQLIVENDCGTTRGISLKVDDPEVLDRYTANATQVKGSSIPAGTLVTPELLGRLRNNKITRLPVRSPLKCDLGEGICKKCYGLTEDGHEPSMGSNVGAVAAQAIGEPAVNLSMKSFHTGGVVSAGGGAKTDDFTRLSNLLKMPETLRGSATISEVTGTVRKDSIKEDPAGGWRVIVKGTDRFRNPQEKEHYIPGSRKLSGQMIKALAGEDVKIHAGEPISSGPINPKELLRAAGIEQTRNFLTNEMYDTYKKVGPVKRRNMEVVVRAVTNLTDIEDPGDSDWIRGDTTRSSLVAAKNRELVKKGKKPAAHRPILRGINQVPLDMQEDWLARLQYQALERTIVDGVTQGWKSDIHGLHPIPAMVYGEEFGMGSTEKPYAY